MDYILEENIDILKKQIYCDDGIILCPSVDVNGEEGKEFTKAVEYVIKRVIDYDETIVDYFRDEDEMIRRVVKEVTGKKWKGFKKSDYKNADDLLESFKAYVAVKKCKREKYGSYDSYYCEDEMLEDVMLSYQDLLKYLRTECVAKTTLKKFIKYHLSSESHKDIKELLERLL